MEHLSEKLAANNKVIYVGAVEKTLGTWTPGQVLRAVLCEHSCVAKLYFEGRNEDKGA